MSQHLFTALDGKHLVTGYDRRMGEFFYLVFAKSSDENEMHNSSGDPLCDTRSVSSVRSKVETLLDGIPPGLWESIEDDAINDVGNRVVHWTLQGTIKFDSASIALT